MILLASGVDLSQSRGGGGLQLSVRAEYVYINYSEQMSFWNFDTISNLHLNYSFLE